MEELCKKYPALDFPFGCVDMIVKISKQFKVKLTEFQKAVFYKHFKANISCIGLEPEEYETVIKWFCDTMEY